MVCGFRRVVPPFGGSTGGRKLGRFLARGCPVSPTRRAAASIGLGAAVSGNRNLLGGQKMAKSGRVAASSTNNSKSKRREAVERRQATSAALRKSANNKAASDAVLLVEDQFNNLRAAHRA